MNTFIGNVIDIIGIIVPIIFLLLIIAFPFLSLYTIYRMIKGLMTHNAELKARGERERIGRDLP